DGTAPTAYAGSASVFERNASGTWVQVAKLTNSTINYFDLFGTSVSIAGNRLVVGAPYEDTAAGTDAGSASVFERNASGQWIRAAKFVDSGSAAYAGLGYSVSISGSRIAVGAVGDDTAVGVNAGSVSIFERNSSANWVRVAKLADSDGAAYDSLGSSVSISGDRMVAGAYGDSKPGKAYVGSASVFERDAAGHWVQVAKLANRYGTVYDEFGISVSTSGGRFVVGTPGSDVGAEKDAGSVQVFTLTESGFDYGDAPAPYPTLKANAGARHGRGALWLGYGTSDSEADGLPDAEARGDDYAATDDEDGISFPEGALILGDSNQAWITVGGQAGFLDAWIDLNRDGDWMDAGERIADRLSVTPGTNIIALPAFPAATSYFARFRLSSAGVSAPGGDAADGEVEDYRIWVTQAKVKLPSTKSVVEGTAFNLKISLNSILDKDVTVQYTTQNGTALAGRDYTAASGTVTIPANQTSVTIKLQTAGDTLVDGDKTFKMLLTGATNAQVNSDFDEAVITIEDDDD
ncbi:MAG TPA: Calx-beta domain-containing protein, partial [Chthoniobacter sp.]|nr:Calx-beta domain-containing protein [Chthoniobacter sp.]